jgi:phage shock protein A
MVRAFLANRRPCGLSSARDGSLHNSAQDFAERSGAGMIIEKIWNALRAQLNKLANVFHGSDPIAQMQYEYDSAVVQLREGRQGLEQYRALVERVMRQVTDNQAQVNNLEAKVKLYLKNGDRDTAGKFALELQKAKKQLAENEAQQKMHEEAYNNNLLKIKHAGEKIGAIREKIQHYDADLKMSRAEAEMAQLAQDFNFDVTTDFGQMEQMIQDKINLNRAKARVAADLSSTGLDEIKKEKGMEEMLANEALKDFEAQMGLASPETVKTPEAAKAIGPRKIKEKA